MDPALLSLLLAAGLMAGGVNALAGGGSLLIFPVMVAAGLPPVQANVTNSVAVVPGYLASVGGSRRDLRGQRRRARALLGTAAVGSGTGCLLLLVTPAAAFEAVVGYLVIGAALLLAFQGPIRGLVGHPRDLSARRERWSLHGVTGVCAVYGGYFGAALGVMLVAGLALLLEDSLARVAALKNAISAAVGSVTVLIYGVFGPVHWSAVLVVAPATLVGGYLGARLGGVLPQWILRTFIVVYGIAAGVYLMTR